MYNLGYIANENKFDRHHENQNFNFLWHHLGDMSLPITAQNTRATENRYQPFIVIDMPATNQNWQGEIRNKYYIQLANGEYGRIDFYLLPYNGLFTVQTTINPDGSRNLEPAQ
jgi:hypothetical protein